MLTTKEKNIIKSYWDNNARLGDAVLSGDVGLDPALASYKEKSEEQLLGRLVKLDKSMNVLELGCGGGRITTYLSSRVQRVTAVDYSEQQIDILRTCLRAMGISNVKILVEDIENLSLTEKYDVIILSHFSIYLDDDELAKLLARLPSWLKAGGRVVSHDSLSATCFMKLNESNYVAFYRTRLGLFRFFNDAAFFCEKDAPSFVNLYSDSYKLLEGKYNGRLLVLVYPIVAALIKMVPFLVLAANVKLRGKKPGIYRLYSLWSYDKNLTQHISSSQFFAYAKPLSLVCYIDNKLAAVLLHATQRLGAYTPNMLTVVSLIFGLLVGLSVLLDTGFAVLAVSSVLAYTFDNADGMLARTRKLTSKLGGFLDWFFDIVKDYFIETCFVYSYLLSQIGNFYFPALVFTAFLYFATKATSHLVSDWKELERVQVQRVSIYRYTPAEKYILMYPVMYLFPSIIPVVFLFHFFGYLLMIARRFLKEVAT